MWDQMRAAVGGEARDEFRRQLIAHLPRAARVEREPDGTIWGYDEEGRFLFSMAADDYDFLQERLS